MKAEGEREYRISEVLRGAEKLHKEGFLALRPGESFDDYARGMRKDLEKMNLIQLRTEAKFARDEF